MFAHGVVNGSRSVRRRVELGRAHRREVRSPPTCRSFDLVVARLTRTLRGPSFTRSQRVPSGDQGQGVKVKVKVGAKLNRFRFALGRKMPSL